MMIGAGSGFMPTLKRMKFGIVLVLLVAIMPVALTGCYGKFPLTGKIYDFNGEVSDNKWVKTIVMWVLFIVPVYEIGVLADAIVFNLYTFWTGEELMEVTTATDSNGNTVVLAPGENQDEAVLTVSRDGEILTEQRFVRLSSDLVEVRGAEGELTGTVVKADDGQMNLTDANGNVVGTLNPDSISALTVN